MFIQAQRRKDLAEAQSIKVNEASRLYSQLTEKTPTTGSQYVTPPSGKLIHPGARCSK